MVTKKLVGINEGSKDKPRCMSSHVSSRWYRAPELSLIERQYDQASDMWSLGCCIYELLHCSLETKEVESKEIENIYRHILFQGESSYPLSPKPEKNLGRKYNFDSNDQLY